MANHRRIDAVVQDIRPILSAGLFALALAAAAFWATGAAAQDEGSQMAFVGQADVPYGALAGLVDGVYVSIVDNVTDGCWTNGSDVRDAVVYVLTEAGVEVGDSEDDYGFSPIQPRLDVQVAGQRHNEACLASAQMVLHYNNLTQIVFPYDEAIAGVRTSQINIMWMNIQALAAADNVNEIIEPWARFSSQQLAQQITVLRDHESVTNAQATWAAGQ